jgi:(S)-ureidoglycine aminohydrolase
MKFIATITALFLTASVIAQVQPLVSSVYSWDSSLTRKNSSKKIFSGSGAILASHTVQGVTVVKGSPLVLNPDSPLEKFFIIKNGPVLVQLNDSSKILDRGSIVSVIPGDRAVLTAQNATAQLYEMDYTSIAPPNAERGKQAGGSFMLDWNTISFRAHDKGGVRQFFDRKTVMLNRFDIHVTTLNPNNNSHAPHTHKNEEIILMLQGNAEMQIGTDHQKANPGDVVFLGSNVLHNLTNVGTVPCIYYAIQWN